MRFNSNILRVTVLTAILIWMTGNVSGTTRYAGGDISCLPEYENAGAKYFTHSGELIPDFLTYCYDEGMNAMRVRLFVDPSAYKGSSSDPKDPNACQDLDYILPLCQRIVKDGYALLLDFHYSDTWADPGKQFTPASWSRLNDEELVKKIKDYTVETLQKLKDAGVTPKFIQPGNEISYGMLWGPEGTLTNSQKKVYVNSSANWSRFASLLESAITGCRELCPEAKIILHTERVAEPNVLKEFYNKLNGYQIDYDIIGLSYYPYYHGNLKTLETALNTLESSFPEKEIMIVETGYSYKWEVPGTNQKVDYDYSDAGQAKYAEELVSLLEKHESVTGLFWWWMEYNAYGTSLSGWYNAPLFDSTTGKATSALKIICGFAEDTSGVSAIEPSSLQEEMWFNVNGHSIRASNEETLPRGLWIRKGEKIFRR